MNIRDSKVMLLIAVMVATLAISTDVRAAASVPNTFTPGSTISSGAVNANFTALTTQMPAVKQTGSMTWSAAMTGTAAALQSITFTAPGNGFAIIMATGSVYLDTLSGTASNYCIDLDSVSGLSGTGGCTPNFGSDSAVRSYFPATYPDTSGIAYPYSMIKVVAVAIGAQYTYYVNGYASGFNSAYLFQPAMTVIFVPNALP